MRGGALAFFTCCAGGAARLGDGGGVAGRSAGHGSAASMALGLAPHGTLKQNAGRCASTPAGVLF